MSPRPQIRSTTGWLQTTFAVEKSVPVIMSEPFRMHALLMLCVPRQRLGCNPELWQQQRVVAELWAERSWQNGAPFQRSVSTPMALTLEALLEEESLGHG